MENASKALIIAGAILLSIAIIGIAMFIYTQAEDTIKSAGTGLSTQQITTFNAEYTAYEGTRSGTVVRTLLDKIRTFNIENNEDSAEQIGVLAGKSAAAITETANAGSKAATDINKIKADIKPGSKYTIDFGYDGQTGRVISMGISGGHYSSGN